MEITEDWLGLGIDTETTGFKKGGGLMQEGQARVCQIAMVLVDWQGKPLVKFSSLIKPEGWTISKGASECNGLTDVMCERTGQKQIAIMSLYFRLCELADVVIAHNSAFDKGMMEVETAYYHRAKNEHDVFHYHHPNWYCTQKENVDICKIPPTEKMIDVGRTHYKTPSLEEALQHFCGRSVGENSHDALVDTEACLDIFFASREQRQAA